MNFMDKVYMKEIQQEKMAPMVYQEDKKFQETETKSRAGVSSYAAKPWADLLEEERKEATKEGSYKNACSYQVLIAKTFQGKEYSIYNDRNLYSLLTYCGEAGLSYKERRRRVKRYKKAKKELGEERVEKYKMLSESQKLITAEDVQAQELFLSREGRDTWANTKMGHTNLTRREIVERVGKGDYSNFENLDDTMRNMFANEAFERMLDKYGLKDQQGHYSSRYESRKYHASEKLKEIKPKDICGEILKEGGVTALLDPALRLGLSLAHKEKVDIVAYDPYSIIYKNDKAWKERREYEERRVYETKWFGELDEQMSTAVMLETLKQKDENELTNRIANELESKQKMSQKKALKAAQGMVEADKAQKIQTAKRLLLMHMGKFTQVDEIEAKGEKITKVSDWDKPVAVALSHCSRVTLTLPRCPGEKNGKKVYREMWDSIFYQEGKSNLAQDNRRAASTHSIEIREKDFGQEVVEKKVPFNLMGQRGMNVAVGGLGNAGVSGKMILNDGSCGHFYSMYQEGDTERYGAILMGLESDCPGVTNQLGHTHDIRAAAERASSLGGQRTDEVGIKYGGRRCNLGELSPEEITKYMNLLEKAMRENASGMNSLMEKLVGPPMSEKSLREFKTSLENYAKPERKQK